MRNNEDISERAPGYAGEKKQPDQYTFDYEPIRGYPELRWTGKRPFRGTSYFPAQLKESHGDTVEGWRNKIYWGDNLQVMSHLLREYRGKVRLIYIDPPFDSKADYKKKIELRGASASSDTSAFEEKQYSDIWTNDEYLQFMYERLILMRELLAEDGSIYVHCDWHKSHYIRMILDEVFGPSYFLNEIAWQRFNFRADGLKFGAVHDTIFLFVKGTKYVFNKQYIPLREEYISSHFRTDENGRLFRLDNLTAPLHSSAGKALYFGDQLIKPPAGTMWRFAQEGISELWSKQRIVIPENGVPQIVRYLDETEGQAVHSMWTDMRSINSQSDERLDYPTQKPEALLERIIKASSNPGDLVFDCFMGSGTTQAVAMKLGRRFLGADINLGAVQTTTKRLLGVAQELEGASPELGLGEDEAPTKRYSGFEVYTVNNYDFFRNEVQARELLIEALEIQALPGNSLWDGELDGWMVKILAINRLATAADLNPLLSQLDYKAWDRRARENPGKPVERIKLVCMGHDPELKAVFLKEMDTHGFKVEVAVLDILRDKAELQFRRDSEAKVVLTKKKLEIKRFYPMNLLQKLSLEKTKVEDWRELVDSVYVDWNYDGAVFSPALVDIPEKNELVKGVYEIPEGAGTVRVKITDLISESWEGNV
jgi:adenine-specific DNA-methyltransferase